MCMMLVRHPQQISTAQMMDNEEIIIITKDFLSRSLSNGTLAEWAVTGQLQKKCRCGPMLINHILFALQQ